MGCVGKQSRWLRDLSAAQGAAGDCFLDIIGVVCMRQSLRLQFVDQVLDSNPSLREGIAGMLDST